MIDDDFCQAWEEAGDKERDRLMREGAMPDHLEPLPELEYLDYLVQQLPPIIARKRVRRIFGGAVSVGTLANADSKGDGPRNRFYIGRTVVYPTVFLLEWLEKRGACPQVATDWRADDE